MRTLLLTVVMSAILTTSAAAYDYGYVGLFADEARTSWCLESPPYETFDMYVFCLPSDNGVRAVEFSIGMPPTYIIMTSTPGPTVSVTLGDHLNGISYGLYLCSTDWILLDHCTLLPMAAGEAAIWLKGHADTGEMSIANCLPGYPIEQALAYTSLFVNYPPGSAECSGVATEETSWGAIKEMLR